MDHLVQKNFSIDEYRKHFPDWGRSVGAVPGPVSSAASSRTNRLIREHRATLITNTDEAAEL